LVRRSKRFNLPKPLKIRNLIPVVVLVILGLGVFNWLRAFVVDSPYFKISKVEICVIGRALLTDKTVKELLTVHKGRNIFDVDLKTTRDYIMAHYPEVRTIVINREFPNKLILNIRPRRPIAQVSMYSGFCLVDAEGVILPGVRGLSVEGLPIIKGVDSGLVSACIGRKSNHLGLIRALRLIGIINQMRFSQGHEIHMIDVSDEKNLSFYIEGGIEIKIGGENFRERVAMLNKTFDTGRLDKSQIRYIDLRFGNVIIGPK